MVKEFNGQHINRVDVLERGNVDVLALCNVQEHTINEEEEGLNVQMLAPAQAQIKKELREPLVINASLRFFFEFLDFFLLDALIAFSDLLGLSVRVEF